LFLPMPDAALWSPEAPNLHGLTVNVGNETRRIRFGLRRVEALGSKLLLNGEPFYVRGFGCDGNSRGCLRRQVQTPPGFCNYVTRAKQFGFNVMRSHCGGNDRPEGFLDACDELGLFIWPELDFGPDGDGSILAHFWNHPSVIWWCWGNEIAQERLHPWARRSYDFVKSLDPSRLVLDNSGLGGLQLRSRGHGPRGGSRAPDGAAALPGIVPVRSQPADDGRGTRALPRSHAAGTATLSAPVRGELLGHHLLSGRRGQRARPLRGWRRERAVGECPLGRPMKRTAPRPTSKEEMV